MFLPSDGKWIVNPALSSLQLAQYLSLSSTFRESFEPEGEEAGIQNQSPLQENGRIGTDRLR